VAVGTIGFFGPPGADGVVMIGYGLVTAARGHGYATEALRAIVGVAVSDSRVQWIEADPERDNAASHRVLEKAGFTVQREEGNARWYSLRTDN
jgi:RimJ/RimL family protein N-acetyltransferase